MPRLPMAIVRLSTRYPFSISAPRWGSPWNSGAFGVSAITPPDWSRMRSTALSVPATRSSWRRSNCTRPVDGLYCTIRLRARRSAETSVWWPKSSRIRRWVSSPTAMAKVHRIAKVSAADVSARRQRMERRSSTQHVSRAADRVQQPRLATGLELATHVGDEDLDGVRLRERVVAPDLVEHALARDDDALVAHQVLQQLELALGELDVAIATADLVGVGVELEVAGDQRRRAPRRAPPQQRAQAGQQLLALEGLDEVVVGARVEALDARLDRVARGEHEDRHVVGRAQPARDLDAVELRQPEVEDHEVGVVGGGLVERRLAVAGDAHVVAVQAQGALEDLGDLVVVLDDEHPWIATDTVHAPRRVERAMNAK